MTAELEPLWHPSGSPNEMISTAISTHLRWLTEHVSLHRYLARAAPGPTDVRDTIARHLSGLFAGYLTAFGRDPAPADTIAFGLVGYVESATTRWLDHPGALTLDQLTAQLAARSGRCSTTRSGRSASNWTRTGPCRCRTGSRCDVQTGWSVV